MGRKGRSLWLMLLEQLREVEGRILAACQRGGRSRSDVQLLLASKKVAAPRLLELPLSPPPVLGENTVQELLAKQKQLEGKPFRWHFIGHLQSNKVKDLIGRCDLIHSVDRFSLAQEISKRSAQKNLTTNILVEINTSGETSKSGAPPDQALTLIRQISMLPNILVKGLMTIAENTEDEACVRNNFRALKALYLAIKKENLEKVQMTELSMGMSQDFEWAIEEGATLVRIGSLIFGERS